MRSVMVAVMGVALVAAVAVDVKRGVAKNYEFLQGYNALKAGLTRAEVEALLLAPATHECRFYPFRVCYYVRQPGRVLGILEGPIPSGLPSDVAAVSDLPDIYAAVQVAFTTDERLVAFTWNGETGHVVPANGKRVPGSSLRILGPELLPMEEGAKP